MKKIKGMILTIIGCLGLLFLAACSNNSVGLSSNDVEMDIATTSDKATIKLTLSENDNVKSGKALLYITCKKADDESSSAQKQNVTFSNSIYTSSTVTFQSLTVNQEYNFILYATYDGYDTKIIEKTAKTSDSVSTTIASKSDFEAIVNDKVGEFNITEDIDFSGESVGLFKDASSAFQGKIDGGIYDANGNLTGCHTIKNFKLTANTNIGLFGYLKGATIKNLIIEDVSAEYSSRSTADMGALVGHSVDSYIENVKINNFNLKLAASSTAVHNTGGVVGYSERSTFKNVYADNVTIDYTSAKIKINAGLFAGTIQGDALTEGVVAKSCGVKGTLNVVAEYNSSSSTEVEYINVGGFVGQIGSNGKIDDCYTEASINYSRKEQMTRTFNLSIGGFVGCNNSNMNITNSLSINTIKAYAGLTPTDGEGHDYSLQKFASGTTYVAGFIGKASNVFRGINNCYSKAKAEIVAEGVKEITEDNGGVTTTTTICYVDNFCAKADTQSSQYITNSSAITTEIPEGLSDSLKALLA